MATYVKGVSCPQRVPHGMLSKLTPLRVRILEYSIPVPEAGCWLWTKGIYPSGYGQTKILDRGVHAHRAAWIAFKGPIPEGMYVCHKCDTPLCVNPDHMFLGTQRQNLEDCRAKDRRRQWHKISPETALAIYRDKRPLRKIPAIYGVSRGTVDAIKYGKTWVAITGHKK